MSADQIANEARINSYRSQVSQFSNAVAELEARIAILSERLQSSQDELKQLKEKHQVAP